MIIFYTGMWKKLTSINRILVPVDLTDASLCAVEAALVLSAERKSQIYLLHVFEMPQGNSPAAAETAAAGGGARATGGAGVQDDTGMRKKYAAMEEFFQKKIRPQSKFACIVRSGDPAREILKFASEEGVDLIVLPVGTRPPDGALRSGGIADRVVRNAAVPVVVVKPEQAVRKLSDQFLQERKEKSTMSHDERYLQEIRDKVCRKCIDRTASGLCVTSTYDSCAINRYLPELIDIVLTTPGDDLDAYVAVLRERVCSTCGHQSADGHCDMRDDVECALDRYFPLIVEAIQEVNRTA